MSRLAKLQLIGPMVLAAVIATEELATYLLASHPSSEFAWYLNLNVFRMFQRSHYIFSDHISVPYVQLLFVGLPVIVLATAGATFRIRLLSAVASNLSLVYVFMLAYAWYSFETPTSRAASLVGIGFNDTWGSSSFDFTPGAHVYVFAALLIPTLFSFAASHLIYLRVLRES